VAFSITFSDGWVTTNGTNTIPIGTSYTLPTYTSSLPVTVTGASDFNFNTAGTYKVVYTSIGIDELARRVVRRFVVEYPTIAFHYAGFVATDYNSTYATKEAAAADGFVYADTPDGTYSWGTLTVTSNTTSNTQYTWTPVTAITADVLMVAGGGGGGYDRAGGGGAGGLVFSPGVSFSGQKTIVVGNGGVGSNSQPSATSDGSNTYVSGMVEVVGGGRGASGGSGSVAGSGGSGGGGRGSPEDNLGRSDGGASTDNQGNNGGNAVGGNSGGGGGAGGAGGDGVSGINPSNSGNGGLGLNLISVYGTKYGDSGWFASGGGGGIAFDLHTDTTSITSSRASQGGGGDAGLTRGADGENAKKHTGGGGGGGANISQGDGGNGGSGIVLVKRTA